MYCFNNAMDQVAKKLWQHIQMSLDPIANSLLGEPWELWLEHEKVSTTIKSWLLKHMCGQAAREYWANKSRFRGMGIQSIDWTVIQTVVMAMTIKQCQWMTKFTTGFCATGQMMHRWGK